MQFELRNPMITFVFLCNFLEHAKTCIWIFVVRNWHAEKWKRDHSAIFWYFKLQTATGARLGDVLDKFSDFFKYKIFGNIKKNIFSRIGITVL